MNNEHASLFFMICSALLVIALLEYAWVTSPTEPTVPPEVQDSCNSCYLTNYGASFENPVLAYYWLEVREQTEPDWVIMKYDLYWKCNDACTIQDRNQEQKMIDYVTGLYRTGDRRGLHTYALLTKPDGRVYT